MSRKGVLRNYDSEGNLISKECYKCHEIKAVSEFNKDKSKKDGVYTICKDCRKEYYNQNTDKIAEYRKQNKDKLKEYKKEWYQQNADKIKERQKGYHKKRYKENADKLKQYQKQWRKENKDKKAEYDKEYNKERYDSKVEQSLIEIKAYVEQNPQRYDYNPNKEIYGIIYLVHNVKSDKYYIGQTTRSFDIRYNMGWLYEHSFKDTVKEDLEKYGKDSFEYIKIFKVAHTQQDLDKLEAYYIDYYNSYDNGYNENRGNIFTERTHKIKNIRFDWVA